MFNWETIEASFKSATDTARESFERSMGRILIALTVIADGIDALDVREETIRRGPVQLTAAVPEQNIVITRPGWIAAVTRVTVICDAAADVELYAGAVADGNLIYRKSNAAAARSVEDVGNPVEVPSRGQLVARMTAGAANCTVAIQGTLMKSREAPGIGSYKKPDLSRWND